MYGKSIKTYNDRFLLSGKSIFSFLCRETETESALRGAFTRPSDQVLKYESTLGQLSKEEAIEYLTSTLEIPDPVTLKEQNPYKFLCEVQRRTRWTQPYNNIIFLQDGMSYPTLEENKEVMKKKQGGGCLGINSFTKELLVAMGYQAYNPGAGMPKERTSQYEGHRGLFVKNVTHPGSLHLLEPGSTHPILEPIPLDFERVSPIYQLVTHEIRMFRDCPRIVKLCGPALMDQEGRRMDPNLYIEDGMAWRVLMTYNDREQSLSSFYDIIEFGLTNLGDLFHNLLREIIIIGFSGGLWTSIRGNRFTQYDDDGEKSCRFLETNEEIIQTARKCFPQYSELELQKTINHCNYFREKMTYT